MAPGTVKRSICIVLIGRLPRIGPLFLCGISHILSRPAKFIYLFICGLYLAFNEPWRLDSSRRFFIVYYTAAISLLSRWVLENLFGISYFFLGNFCFQGKDRSFHIFTGSFRALTFQFCCGSFTIKLSGKATTFVHLVCVLSYIIWGVGNIYNGVICD